MFQTDKLTVLQHQKIFKVIDVSFIIKVMKNVILLHVNMVYSLIQETNVLNNVVVQR